jgi:hypothetical protein
MNVENALGLAPPICDEPVPGCATSPAAAGSDPVPPQARLDSDDRALPRVQTEAQHAVNDRLVIEADAA